MVRKYEAQPEFNNQHHSNYNFFLFFLLFPFSSSNDERKILFFKRIFLLRIIAFSIKVSSSFILRFSRYLIFLIGIFGELEGDHLCNFLKSKLHSVHHLKMFRKFHTTVNAAIGNFHQKYQFHLDVPVWKNSSTL